MGTHLFGSPCILYYTGVVNPQMLLHCFNCSNEFLFFLDVKEFCMSYLSDFVATRSAKKPRKQPTSSVKHYPECAGRLVLMNTAVRKSVDSSGYDSVAEIDSPDSLLDQDGCIAKEAGKMTVEVQHETVNVHDADEPEDSSPCTSHANRATEAAIAYHKDMSALRSDTHTLHLYASSDSSTNAFFGSFLTTAQVLNILVDPNHKCVTTVPGGAKNNVYFVVENPHYREKPRVGIQYALSDESNQWQAKTHAFAYFMEKNKKFTEVRRYQNLICKRNPRHSTYTPFDPQPDENAVIKLAKTMYVSVLDENYKRRITYLDRLPEGCKPMFIVEYSSPFVTKG